MDDWTVRDAARRVIVRRALRRSLMYQSSTLTTAGFSPLAKSQRVDGIFLAGLGLVQHGRQCGQYFTGLSLASPGRFSLDMVPSTVWYLSRPFGLEHEQIARGVGGLVDAILLPRIAGRGELHAGPVLDAERVADVGLDLGDGVGDGAALLEGRSARLVLWHQRGDRGDLRWAERVGASASLQV